MNMKESVCIFCAVIALAFCASAAQAQGMGGSASSGSASLANDVLGQWNRAGSLLLGMAKDVPDDKMDFRPTPAVRTLAEQLLHATLASAMFNEMAGGTMPKSFDDVEHPSRDKYKTRQQMVDLIQKTFADGAAAIQKYGDKGLLEAVDSPFEKGKKVTRAWMYTFATAHVYDHYGQCVTYYRINGLVPPETRAEQQQK